MKRIVFNFFIIFGCFLLAGAVSCVRQEGFAEVQTGSPRRVAEAWLCDDGQEGLPGTRSELTRNVTHLGQGQIFNWIVAIYDSGGNFVSNVYDDIRADEVDFHYPHVHIVSDEYQYDTDGLDDSRYDIPYCWGYTDEPGGYTVFVLKNVPIYEAEDLEAFAQRMFHPGSTVSSVMDSRIDFLSLGGMAQLKDFGFMPKASVGNVVFSHQNNLPKTKRLFHQLNFSVVNGDSSIVGAFSASDSRICNMAVDILPFRDGESSTDNFNVSFQDCLTADELSSLSSGGTVSFFIPENCWGDSSSGNSAVDSRVKRHPTTLSELGFGQIAANATYIEASFSLSSDSFDDPGKLRYYLSTDYSDFGDFNVLRNHVSSLTFNLSLAKILENDWEVEIGRDRLDYRWESPYEASGKVHSFSPSHQFDLLCFFNHYCERPAEQLEYSITIHNFKDGSGNVLDRTVEIGNVADHENEFVDSYYYPGISSECGFSITPHTTGGVSDGDRFDIQYLGTSSNPDEVWEIYCYDSVTGESTSAFFRGPSTGPVMTGSYRLDYYVGQKPSFTSSENCKWMLVETDGNPYGYLSGEGDLYVLQSAVYGTSVSLSFYKSCTFKLRLVSLDDDSAFSDYYITVHDPILQWNDGGGWFYYDQDLMNTFSVVNSSKTVSFRYVDVLGNHLTDFDSYLYNQLLVLRRSERRSMYTLSPKMLNCNVNTSAATATVSLNSFNNSTLSSVMAVEQGDGGAPGLAVICPAYQYSSSSSTAADRSLNHFNWFHHMENPFSGFGNRDRVWEVDNRYFLTDSQDYAVFDVDLPVRIDNINRLSVSVGGFPSRFDYTGSPGNYTVTRIKADFTDRYGQQPVVFTYSSSYGTLTAGYGAPFGGSMSVVSYINIGWGVFSHRVGTHWYISPVFINDRNGVDVKTYVGDGVVMFWPETVFQDHIDEIVFEMAQDGFESADASFSSSSNDDMGDTADATVTASLRINNLTETDPSGNVPDGYVSGNPYYALWNVVFVENEGGYPVTEHFVGYGGNMYFVPQAKPYTRVYSYFNKNWE